MPTRPKILCATLLTSGSLTIATDEILAVVRHWRMLVLYVVSAALTFAFRYPADDLHLELWVDLLIFLWLHFLPAPLVITWALLIARLGRNKPVHNLFISPVLYVSFVLSAISTEAIFGIMRGEWQFDATKIFAWSLLGYIFGEIGAATAFNVVIPPILSELRLKETTQAAPIHKVAVVKPPSVSEPPGPFFTVSNRAFSARQLLYIHADGNYVDIVLKAERAFVLATLSSVVSQLQDVDGCLVSRSLWVSAAAIKGYRRQGKNYLIEAVDGTEFRVARSRNEAVIPWLTQRYEEAT